LPDGERLSRDARELIALAIAVPDVRAGKGVVRRRHTTESKTFNVAERTLPTNA
jgi:hypothetical protein